MNNATDIKLNVLSIYPTSIGFSYSYFESLRDLIDWGNCIVQDEDIGAKIQSIIDQFKAEVIVTEDNADGEFKRDARVASILDEIYTRADENDITLKKYSHSTVKGVFDLYQAHNKYEIAKVLATWLPELASKLPPEPKIWLGEHYRIPQFCAISYAITYFYIEHSL